MLTNQEIIPSFHPPTTSIASEKTLLVDAIQKNDFLRRLDEEQTAMMVELLVVNSFKPGEDVIKEGSEGDCMYIVAGEGRHA